MMKVPTLIILAILSLLTACSKQLKPVYTIEGRLFYDCNNEAVSLADITLYGKYRMGTIIVAETTTDENGYFIFSYKRYVSGTNPDLSIFTGSSSSATATSIMKFIPTNTDILIDTLYLQEVGALTVYLEASEPYTSTDTLYVHIPFSDAGDGTLNGGYIDAFPGPFATGFLKEYIVNKNSNGYGSAETRRVTWYINKYIKEEAQDQKFEIYGCHESDIVTITIP